MHIDVNSRQHVLTYPVAERSEDGGGACRFRRGFSPAEFQCIFAAHCYAN
jgi:hypothetical protein